MAGRFYVNQRVSYSTSLCTIRYIGPVDGTAGEWLGVEWDEPLRGKHSGEHAGKKYFDCAVANAGSFIRPSRAPDPPLTFVQALRKKYIDDGVVDVSAQRPIEWGGKVVQEIGFDKIRQKLRKLKELRIVLVDGLQIAKEDPVELITETCPEIEDLNLSRNLFDSLQSVEVICRALPKLRSLRISGNRFSSLHVKAEVEREDGSLGTGFDNITSLELEETLLSWEELAKILPLFPSLQILDLSLNRLSSIPQEIGDILITKILTPKLTELKLERNKLTNISSILPASLLPNLRKLLLARNQISSIYGPDDDPETPILFKNIRYLDLSFNSIPSFKFINAINSHFPDVEGLRITHNPLYEVPGMGSDEAHMLTVGRLNWKVRLLNFTTITIQERTNAELYYLGRIAKEMAEVAEGEEEELIVRQHPRWNELCKAHGKPIVNRSLEVDRQSLGRNLINIEFVHNNQSVVRKIPKHLTVSALKGIVGILFPVRPLRVTLEILLDNANGRVLENELKRLEVYVEEHKEVKMLVKQA
ncbi:RNI-like protein [Terfezia boudieri ATCC MYA-4762]|uniref:RNI-like protein n=1 Tax=Terfezia boudieri ATCC MYA-4762 TaxID=1051890 RepID=A0A3N4M095_9PEZI|nr:RNI-like protein [Terfezia boudieri ATCC MYA-4762]